MRLTSLIAEKQGEKKQRPLAPHLRTKWKEFTRDVSALVAQESGYVSALRAIFWDERLILGVPALRLLLWRGRLYVPCVAGLGSYWMKLIWPAAR